MSTHTDELLSRAAELRDKVFSITSNLQYAKTRDAILEDQLTKLANKLAVAADGVDWESLDEAVRRAAERVEDAVLTLVAKLDEAGVEY